MDYVRALFNTTNVVCVSGYFDPIHIEHIEYLKKAKSIGTFLIVIVNNDYQAELTERKVFMKDYERSQILRELSCVDEVVISKDTDKTVCKTLELIKPDTFVIGENKTIETIPESEICNKYDIKLIDNIGY